MRRSWPARHAVDLALAGLVIAAFVYLFGLTSDSYFQGDDWGLLHQGSSIRGMVQPYNDHLSVTILVVYRALIEVFGFTYWPFRAVGLICFLAVPVSFFATTRRTLGPPLAAAGTVALLGFAGDVEINPALLNHYLTLVGGIVCAAALNRGPRADWLLAGALTLALSATGGGVAVAAACIVHVACTRAPRRRWLAVIGPIALWGVWWLAAGQGGGSRFRPPERPALADGLGFVGDLTFTPFEHLAVGSLVLASALAAAFAVYGLKLLRRGPSTAANFLAWITALAVWAVGLTLDRGGDAPVFYRYQLVALAFVLLAVVPRSPIRWPARSPLATDGRWLTAAAACVLAVGVGLAITVHEHVEARAAKVEAFGRLARDGIDELDGLPDDAATSELFFDLTVGEVRDLLDRYN